MGKSTSRRDRPVCRGRSGLDVLDHVEAEPSQADELITLRLKDALGLVDIRVLDHLIVGDNRCDSLAERGVI